MQHDLTPIALERTRLEPSPRPSAIRRVFSRIAQALTLPGLASHEPRAVLAWLSLEPTPGDGEGSGLAEAEQRRTGYRQLFCWRVH